MPALEQSRIMLCSAGALGLLPAALCNNSSGFSVEHLGLLTAAGREAFTGCECATAFVTHSRRQNLLGTDRKTPANLGGCYTGPAPEQPVVLSPQE